MKLILSYDFGHTDDSKVNIGESHWEGKGWHHMCSQQPTMGWVDFKFDKFYSVKQQPILQSLDNCTSPSSCIEIYHTSLVKTKHKFNGILLYLKVLQQMVLRFAFIAPICLA